MISVKRVAFSMAMLLAAVAGAMAQSEAEARVLAEDGDIDGAVAMLRAVTAEDGRNQDAALLLADLLWNSGRDDEAVEIYGSLRKKGNREALLQLGRIALARYDIGEARTLLADYRKTLRKGKKQIADDMSGNLEVQIDKAEAMLDRVQNIEVIDSVDVDADEFFKRYPVSPAAGRFYGPEALPDGFPSDGQTIVHVTESGNKMVWSAPDDDGNYRLYGSSALLGGEWEAPHPLGEDLAEGGDAGFAYLMPDGITLYYANDGENSLGGYDIFLSREGEDGFLQPANVGMPFNSPFNDYLLVIDEFTGAGWFATDRNRIPGKVTIYTFIPQDLRVNVDIDNPALASLARLDNIAATRRDGADYSSVRRAIAQGASMQKDGNTSPDFLFALPGDRVYTSLDDFRSRKARNAMQGYLAKRKKFENVMDRLEELRRQYGKGDRSQGDLILNLEGQLDQARAELDSLRYEIIQLEGN